MQEVLKQNPRYVICGYWESGNEVDYELCQIDRSTNSLLSTNSLENAINDGRAFQYTHSYDIPGSATISFLIVTPNTNMYCHFSYLIDTQSELLVSFYQDAIPDSNGTLVTNPAVINRNGNSSNSNTTLLYGSPTLGGGSKGTLLKTHHKGTGKSDGGMSQSQLKRILKANSKHWVDIQNLTVSANYVSWDVQWEEREDKN